MAHHTISIIDFFSLESALATEFRRLLNTLQNPLHDHELKSVLVTSAMLSEGKSTVCAFLAVTAAKKGLRTLLVDSDLRRPSLHKLFVMPRELGLVDVLAEGAAGKSVVKKTSLDKLDLVTAGKVVAHPAEVFDAPAIGRLIAEMKFYYDLIVVDSAPIIPVSDPMLLAPEMDGVLIVVRAGSTQRDVVHRAKEIMGAATNRVLGIVLNNAENSLPYYYDQGYYGYDYGQKAPGGGKSGVRNNSRNHNGSESRKAAPPDEKKKVTP
ncbi:MAG: CpsD/CapB family tyrosine-protein kinase [Candidatus Zixiibacteriota bacterium]